MQDGVREVLREFGRLTVPVEGLGSEDNLFAAGLDSMAVVNVMLGLEERFGIEIPERLLTRRAFSSLAALERLVGDAMAMTA